jgi:starch synthase (maltosyl-transferring)
MKIYNLFPLLAGKLTAWAPHLERAAAMGFDWIFVNPIQKPGRSGSLYSIADYHQINPVFVDQDSEKSPEEQVQEAVRAGERLGMKFMVDLVINHCAEDCDIVEKHPQWFVHESDGSVAHPFCMEDGNKVVWYDLARIDHRHTADPEGLYRYIREIVDYLIGLGFTGFRCDAAYQIPASLWRRLITEVTGQQPEIMFTAETLGCTADQTKATADAGFHYVFNSSKWWDFGSPWLMEQYHLVRESAPSIGFPESHDTDRLFAESGGNVATMKQRYVFAAVFSSGVMIPIGYEFGFKKPLHVTQTRPEDWEEPGVDLQEFITKVNAIKTKFTIFQEDCPTNIIGYDNPAILLMWKASTTSPEEALVVLNKDPWNRQHFYVDNLRDFTQAGAPLVDVSPEDPLEYLPVPCSYELRPGEARILVTRRD